MEHIFGCFATTIGGKFEEKLGFKEINLVVPKNVEFKFRSTCIYQGIYYLLWAPRKIDAALDRGSV